MDNVLNDPASQTDRSQGSVDIERSDPEQATHPSEDNGKHIICLHELLTDVK